MSVRIPEGDFAAYIFDCDGTLADSMPVHYQAWCEAFAPYGFDFEESLYLSLGGMPARELIPFLNKRYGVEMPVEETTRRKESLYVDLVAAVRPIDPVLRHAHNTGVARAIGSGGGRVAVFATLDTLGIRNLFGAIVTSEDVTRGKPAPDVFLEAASRLGVPPEKCLVFEDGPLGIEAATAAGMASVLIPTPPVWD